MKPYSGSLGAVDEDVLEVVDEDVLEVVDEGVLEVLEVEGSLPSGSIGARPLSGACRIWPLGVWQAIASRIIAEDLIVPR